VERPPFFYAADTMHPVWDLTREAADPDGGEQLFELHEDDRPRYGVITTQSCDLTEDGASKPKKPWFQVAPLVDTQAVAPSLAADVARGRAKYLYWVPSPHVGDWIADLRIEVPLEKSWLVDRKPIAGFATLDEYERFARHLGSLRARAAIEPGVCTDVVKALYAHLKDSASQEPGVLDEVQRVLLRVIGARAAPSALEVVVVSRGDQPNPAAMKAFDGWYDESVSLASQQGVTLLPIRLQSQFTPDEYERLIMLDLDDLSPES